MSRKMGNSELYVFHFRSISITATDVESNYQHELLRGELRFLREDTIESLVTLLLVVMLCKCRPKHYMPF